jgi:hypothetical protein
MLTGQPLAKLRLKTVPELAPLLSLTGQAAACADGQTDPAALLARLEADGHHTEAVRLIAHALPKREAVWWACMCARHTAPAALGVADQRALEAAEGWVFRGDDALRRLAFEHAQEGNFATPEAWAAVAAFWAGDSMAPAGQAPVPPAPHLAGTAVVGSTLLAAVRTAPERRPARLQRFIEAGRAIADGGPGRLAPEAEAG